MEAFASTFLEHFSVNDRKWQNPQQRCNIMKFIFVFFTKYYYGGQINTRWVRHVACTGERRTHTEFDRNACRSGISFEIYM